MGLSEERRGRWVRPQRRRFRWEPSLSVFNLEKVGLWLSLCDDNTGGKHLGDLCLSVCASHRCAKGCARVISFDLDRRRVTGEETEAHKG